MFGVRNPAQEWEQQALDFGSFLGDCPSSETQNLKRDHSAVATVVANGLPQEGVLRPNLSIQSLSMAAKPWTFVLSQKLSAC